MLRSFMGFCVPTVAAAAATLMALPANATETSFASFSNAPNGSFIATDPGTAAGSLTVTDSSLVDFSFLVTAIAGNIHGITANFVLSASSPNSDFSDTGGMVQQTGFDGYLKFTSTQAITIGATTYAAGSNLLTATFTDAELYGKNKNALHTADSDDGTLVYTSDFLTFSNTIGRDYSISLNAITPKLTIGDINGNPGYVEGFAATPAGTFASDPEPVITADIPEPATWAMMLVGLGAIGLSLRETMRRRMRNA